MSVSSQESVPVDRSSHIASPLQSLFDVGTLGGLTDGQLLERFLRGGRAVAEAAFTLLVERHGPMVLRVCQGVLGDRHDAEDAFQATFLVLARRAGSIRREDAVSSWLYVVARRLSLRLRRGAAHRRELEQRRLAAMGSVEPATTPPMEIWPELYEELDRLPEPFRAAVVLCDLEGNSYDRAAELLHCPVGTIQSRLSRGRQRLRGRLERRGLGSTLALVGRGPLASLNATGVPQTLAQKVVRAAASVPGGESIGGLTPAAVIGLVGSELRRHLVVRVLTVAGTLSMAALVVVGVAMFAGGQREKNRGFQGASTNPSPKANTGPVHVRVVDAQGKSVPGIAVDVIAFGGDELPQRLTTDATGSFVVPRENLEFGMASIARRGDEWLAWMQISDSDSQGPTGTKTDPIIMTFRPLTHRVEGSVVDQQGKPIAAAKVVAQGLSQAGSDSPSGSSVFLLGSQEVSGLPRAVTDQAGRFALVVPEGVRAGLGVHHPRYIGFGAVAEPDAKALKPMVMEPAGIIAGRVVDAVTGQPVPRVLLGAQLIESRQGGLYLQGGLGGWGSSPRADEEGRFAITELVPGVYNLLFESAPGRPMAAARAVEGVRVRGGQSTAALMKVIEGRPLRGIVIDRTTGQTVAGMQVGCYGPARPQSGAAVQFQKTDIRGVFTFHVPPGENFVYLMDGNLLSGRLSRRTIDVPEHGDVELVKLVSVPLSASTQNLYMRKAAVPAPETAVKTKTEVEKGAISPPQPATGKAANENMKDVAQEPAPAPVLQLRTVTGHVRDPRGQPIAGVQVTMNQPPSPRGEPPEFGGIAATDREGMFVLAGIPRQALQITLQRAGFNYQQEDLAADRSEVDYTFRLTPDASSIHRPVIRRDDPVPADVNERLRFISLAGHGNEPLTDGPGGSSNDLNRLPRGVRECDGQYFRVGEDMVHLAGTMTPNLPGEVKAIRVHGRGQKLHFLHAVQQSVAAGTEVGAYVVHYADGSTERIPIVYGRDLVNWWLWNRGFQEVPTDARVAWMGTNDLAERNKGLQVRLFARTWINPHPEREIASLDVISAGTRCDPFLVAATLEKDR